MKNIYEQIGHFSAREQVGDMARDAAQAVSELLPQSVKAVIAKPGVTSAAVLLTSIAVSAAFSNARPQDVCPSL